MKNENDGMTRRDFLKGSVVTAAAVGLGSMGVFSHAKAEMIGPNDTINTALVGIGSQGIILIDRLLKVQNVKLVACCDIRPGALADAKKTAQDAEGYNDYQQILERKDIQAVILAVPLKMHASMAIDAMRAGKHVFCEKMMAYSIEDAKHMVRVSRQTGKKLQIGYQRRYDPKYIHAYKMAQDGLLGKITHINSYWNRNASWRRAVPADSTEELTNWRLYRSTSQGLMSELGSHQINVANWITGETPNAVVGIGGLDHWKDGRNILDNVQVIFQYPGGLKYTLQSLTTNQYCRETEHIMGTKGTMVLSPYTCMFYREPHTDEEVWESMASKSKDGKKSGIILDASKSPRLEKAAAEGKVIEELENLKKDAYQLELDDFFLAIRDGHEPICSGKIGMESCVAAIKANDAMDAKQWLDIPSELYKV